MRSGNIEKCNLLMMANISTNIMEGQQLPDPFTNEVCSSLVILVTNFTGIRKSNHLTFISSTPKSLKQT